MSQLKPSLKFNDTVSRFGLDDAMRRAGAVIAAYSGGADSSCLLYHLVEFCKKEDIALVAAHVNHMIRGEDADRDEQFCRSTCEGLGIPIYVLREDVPRLARETGRGLEETARTVRYSFFEEVSRSLTGSADATVVATAHNSDDNLETVIFHLLRGSGTHGLCGIAPLRDARYVRPLLCDSGAEIREWCSANDVPYVIDATNADTDYTRNFIRHSIVPQLEQICQSPQNAVLRMSTLLRSDDELLEKTAKDLVSDGATSLSRSTFDELHPAIASRVLRLLCRNAAPGADSTSTPEERHIREMLRLISSQTTEASLSLPGRLCFILDRHTVRIAPYTEPVEKTEGETVFTYPDDGDVFENERYIMRFSHGKHEVIENKGENIYKLFICRTFCFDKIKNVLHIRYRRPGDTCVFGGKTRKVKKLFIDRKLTAEEKSTLPLLISGDEILWIPTFPPRDGTLARAGEDGLTVTLYEKK